MITKYKIKDFMSSIETMEIAEAVNVMFWAFLMMHATTNKGINCISFFLHTFKADNYKENP